MATIKITIEWSVSIDRFSKQGQLTIDYLRPISIKFRIHNDDKSNQRNQIIICKAAKRTK